MHLHVLRCYSGVQIKKKKKVEEKEREQEKGKRGGKKILALEGNLLCGLFSKVKPALLKLLISGKQKFSRPPRVTGRAFSRPGAPSSSNVHVYIYIYTFARVLTAPGMAASKW